MAWLTITILSEYDEAVSSPWCIVGSQRCLNSGSQKAEEVAACER